MDDPNEDSWLYGSNPEPPEDEDTKDVEHAVDDDEKPAVESEKKTVSL